MIYIIILLLIVILVVAKKILQARINQNNLQQIDIEENVMEKIEETPQKRNISYSSKNIMTDSEINFYHIIKPLEQELNVVIIPQINLASIINKKSDLRFQNELYRNIDYGIFDQQFSPLLLIELNDATHDSYQRKERDKKVKQICADADIKLITFYTKYPNEPYYVIKRIKENLNSQEDNQEKIDKI